MPPKLAKFGRSFNILRNRSGHLCRILGNLANGWVDVDAVYVHFYPLSSVIPRLTLFEVPFIRQQVTRALHTDAQNPSSTSHALSLVRSQPNQYVIASIAGHKYLLASKDLLTVPRLNDVRVGDVLSLSQIHEVGSREYTLRGTPVILSNHVSVEATVVEHAKGKMEHIFKKKRRKGYERTIPHKQTYTRLRIGPIDIRSV
jgi:large subunit ribosomal protein L21